MTTHEFNNHSNQSERRSVQRDCYLSRAQADPEIEAQGRFKKHNPTIVSGIPQYPTIPSGPWVSPDPSGPEPSLGYEIDALPALGGESSPAPVHPFSVETANATEVGGTALPPKGRDSGPLPAVSAHSFRRRF